MIGKIFITRTGYDPQLGKHIKDPYLGPQPSLGACRPDIRKRLREGDHIFVISGKVPQANQFVMAGFEIEAKIDATEAYRLFPEQRLRQRQDGQLIRRPSNRLQFFFRPAICHPVRSKHTRNESIVRGPSRLLSQLSSASGIIPFAPVYIIMLQPLVPNTVA